MAKGITVVKTDAWDNIADGTYQVNGIEEFISVGADETTPIFKDSFNELKVMLKLRTPTGAEGPAMSLTPPEFVALVHAFGGTDFVPAYADRTLSKTLLAGQQAANAGGKSLTVQAKKGWCNNSYDVTLPVGGYTVEFTGAQRTDFKPSLDFFEGDGEWGPYEYLWFKFKVTGDGAGQDTIWKDYEVSIRMTNPFVDRKEVDGTIYDAIADGRPVWIEGLNQDRWQYFIQYFAPNIFEYEWPIHPAQSPEGVCEVTSPQYPIIREALQAKRQVKMYWKKKDKGKGFWFNMADLPASNMGEALTKEEVTEDARIGTTEEFVAFVNGHAWVKEDGVTPYGTIFETKNPITFTEGGKEWAKLHVGGEVGPWSRAGLDANSRRFDVLTPEQLGSLMQEMENQYK